MQKYLMKFSSRVECIDYFARLKELGREKILFYYMTNGGPKAPPRFLSETDDGCLLEVNAAFNGDPPEGFMDHVELFDGFDPEYM